MFAELNSVLDIHQNCSLDGKFILVTDNQVDGNFIVSHFLSLYLKRNNSVCFLAFSQSFNHYNNIGLKLGINCTRSREQKQLVFIDGLKACLESFVPTRSDRTSSTDCRNKSDCAFNFVSEVTSSPLRNLFILVKEQLGILASRNCPTVLIIDDVEPLLDLGLSAADVVDFLNYISVYLKVPCQTSTNCLLVRTHHDTDIDDERCNIVWTHCVHKSNLSICASGLASGFSKDVHGQIDIKWKDIDGEIEKEESRQFKVEENSLRLFAIGTSAAVL
ncbi:PREDICTED: elongator complex protein 6-like [Priapulus caudatus]|uniref:Elongator complex protein 6 n=1 Tax=Priapulus caudatus TaxID=37621 RepID=A0ABM1DU97_PRICU|nr:PREDICTED: elongator complex protein 6-like [Priapulus caudatus]